MPEIIDSKGDSIEKKNVYIKANGWVKAYDSVSREDGAKEYDGLIHLPPQEVKIVYGEVNYESPHGRV